VVVDEAAADLLVEKPQVADLEEVDVDREVALRLENLA
jgi:hypothetical protein